MNSSRKKFPLAALVAITGALAAWPAGAQQGAIVVGEYNDWALHQSRSDKHNICYVASEPKERQPKTANRAAIVFYISTWPKDGVKSEISVKQGYPLKQGAKVTVTVGEETFELTAKDERAYLYDPTQELKLIEAMKKGSRMVVTGVSSRGTNTTDTYSLSGITAALQAMAEKCV